MFTKVSVLVPTRGRVSRLGALITSFDTTTDNAPNAELVFRVDDDDPVTRDFLLAWGGHKVIVGPRMQGYRSMAAFFNELAREATGDVLMCGNDDMVFQTPYWPALVLAEASKYPDGLFDLGITTLNEDHYPFSVVSHKAVDAMGFLWDPSIFWGDIFLRDVMASFGRCVKLPSVQVTHKWAGVLCDVLHIDPVYWTSTHPKAVAASVSRLAALRSIL